MRDLDEVARQQPWPEMTTSAGVAPPGLLYLNVQKPPLFRMSRNRVEDTSMHSASHKPR
jgi:hypothetical protein